MSSSKPQFSITLYRGFPVSTYFTSSAFVSKLETRLRFGGMPHRIDAVSPLNGPRGKIPYIAMTAVRDSEDRKSTSTMLGDSGLIARTLVAAGEHEDINASLGDVDKARDLALRGLIEDRLYWFHYYEMWMENYYTMRTMILGTLPYPAQVVVGLVIFRTVKANLKGQGTGRYTAEEILMMRREVWECLEAMLRESMNNAVDQTPFWIMGGRNPTEADTTLFGTIAAALNTRAAPKAKSLVQSLPAVMEYAKRIHSLYFPDYHLNA